jgi:putative transposase
MPGLSACLPHHRRPILKKRFSEEQIIRILREAEREDNIRAVCRNHQITEQTFYRWRKKYGGMDVSDARRLKTLELENSRLKRLLAERDLEVDALKEVVAKKW